MHDVILVHTVNGDPSGPCIHKICAPYVGGAQIADLRYCVAEALASDRPEVVVANFSFSWEVIRTGSKTRIYFFTLEQEEFDSLTQCHQKVGRPGGSDLWDTWLPALVDRFAAVGEVVPPQFPGGTLIVTSFDYSTGKNNQMDCKTEHSPA